MQANAGWIRARVVPASAGARWWGYAWRSLRASPGTWLGIAIIYFFASMLLGQVPHIGTLAEWLLTPVFMGGVMRGCDAQRRGEALRIAHVFEGFKGEHFVPLLLVGVFNGVMCIVAAIFAAVLFIATVGITGLSELGSLAMDPWRMWEILGVAYLLLVALLLVLAAVLAMTNWFAPALIVLRDVKTLSAMTASFGASMRNWIPFLVYGVVGLAIAIVGICVLAAAAGVAGFSTVLAILTGSAGWESLTLSVAFVGMVYAALVVLSFPLLAASTYASYRDAFPPEVPDPDALGTS
jgi:uncharacterized membrane protein